MEMNPTVYLVDILGILDYVVSSIPPMKIIRYLRIHGVFTTESIFCYYSHLAMLHMHNFYLNFI